MAGEPLAISAKLVPQLIVSLSELLKLPILLRNVLFHQQSAFACKSSDTTQQSAWQNK